MIDNVQDKEKNVHSRKVSRIGKGCSFKIDDIQGTKREKARPYLVGDSFLVLWVASGVLDG
jgi:hypothetical protein